MSKNAHKNNKDNKAYREGIKAYIHDSKNESETNNPYNINSMKYIYWDEGYTDKKYNLI